jgi:wyosine [tRNA(Phe)-imidazoG37] synthetase (radical SAM superfamily)
MQGEYKYLFGPVPSRRLGFSLGVDVVPFKICPFDCIYCQVGRTTDKTLERKEFVDVDKVLAELTARLKEPLKADYITLSGSGEPTLNSRIGDLIEGIKRLTDIPVALLTNAALFGDLEVRKQCCGVDVVLPSLDSGDEEMLAIVNRPPDDFTMKELIDGLCAFRREYSGQIWLEVFLIDSVNDSAEHLEKIKKAAARIKPDKIQLNTSVRPTAEGLVPRITYDRLQEIAEFMGDTCEVIADFSKLMTDMNIQVSQKDVLSMLKRRPCSLEDICQGLGIHRNEAVKYIGHLKDHGAVVPENRGGIIFYKVI